MTEIQTSSYWLSSTALHVTLNAMGLPDYIQMNVSTGAVFACYLATESDLGFDAGHNYKRWPLTAAPTFFNSTTAKYVYVAVPRGGDTSKNAAVVFPSERIDVYGKNADGTQVGSTDFYYVWLQATITASVDRNNATVNRTWQDNKEPDCGSLATEESFVKGGESTWWQWNSIGDTISFLKDIAKATFNSITIGSGSLKRTISRIYNSDDGSKLSSDKTDAANQDAGIATAGYVNIFGNTHFLRKDIDDIVEGVITFRKRDVHSMGADFGTFLQGILAGTGARIDENGNIEAQSITIRGYAKFTEMIINRLQFIEGDYNFTENGTIETVTANDDGTYTLAMRKRWDKDVTAFAENDVVYGSQNNLLTEDEYFTSWFRVDAVVAASNSLIVSVYPDAEVPGGKNFAPVAHMNVARRGNAKDTDRQSTWYISSMEGCIIWLEGVTKPIVEESNYYLMLGRPKNLSIFSNLPINYKQSYMFARGGIFQDIFHVDFNGNPVYTVIDMGIFDSTKQYVHGKTDIGYVTHQVWYGGCAWQCTVEKSTIGLAPRWNNTQWICVSGAGRLELHITCESQFFRKTGINTTLYALLKHADMDITADVPASQYIWTRESGLDTEDAAWNTKYTAGARKISITDADMPSNWATARRVTFRVTVSYSEAQTALESTFTFG